MSIDKQQSNTPQQGGAPISLLVMSRDMCPARSKETLVTVLLAMQLLKRPFKPFFGYGTGHAVYLNELVKSVYNVRQQVEFKVLYIEDDILIPADQAHQVALCIEEADKNKWNLVTNYKLMDGRNVVHHGDGNPYTDTEIERLKLGDPVDLAGLGFYYGTFYADYRFHEGDFSTIDWTFFKEKQLQLQYAPIVCYHCKMGYI